MTLNLALYLDKPKGDKDLSTPRPRLTMDAYQEWARLGASYPALNGLYEGYSALALAGEAGEVAGEVKKAFRDDGGGLTKERRERIIDEAGDVLWYLANLASDLDVSLQEIAEYNSRKLEKRHGREPLTIK